MSTFVMIPGRGGLAWYWHRVVPLLEQAGHVALPVDLPADDDSAGFSEYADRVVERARGHHDVVLVASSLGGFTAPLVTARLPVDAVVLVNAMIPQPGETPGSWTDNTGADSARREAAERDGYEPAFDPGSHTSAAAYFMHDVPRDVMAAAASHQRPQSPRVFGSACDFASWPPVPIHVAVGRDDRFLPVDLQRRVALERLGIDIDELPGGHLIALARPVELADYLLTCVP